MGKINKDTSVIPTRDYCYDATGKPCPYWSCEYTYEESDYMKMRPHRNGKCSFLEIADDDDVDGIGLLFDQVKECGINNDLDEDDDLLYTNKE